jgi:hypothetical protein
MHILIDTGEEFLGALQWYCAIYSSSSSHPQYLGHTCPRSVYTCRDNVCGLCLLDFVDIWGARYGPYGFMLSQLFNAGRRARAHFKYSHIRVMILLYINVYHSRTYALQRLDALSVVSRYPLPVLNSVIFWLSYIVLSMRYLLYIQVYLQSVSQASSL